MSNKYYTADLCAAYGLRPYTVLIEAGSYRDGWIWQAVHPAETVYRRDYTPVQVAEEVAANQTVADGDNWRVRVWEGEGADTGVPATAEVTHVDLGAVPGTEGQDRESYTDDQDRDSYTVAEEG